MGAAGRRAVPAVRNLLQPCLAAGTRRAVARDVPPAEQRHGSYSRRMTFPGGVGARRRRRGPTPAVRGVRSRLCRVAGAAPATCARAIFPDTQTFRPTGRGTSRTQQASRRERRRNPLLDGTYRRMRGECPPYGSPGVVPVSADWPSGVIPATLRRRLAAEALSFEVFGQRRTGAVRVVAEGIFQACCRHSVVGQPRRERPKRLRRVRAASQA